MKSVKLYVPATIGNVGPGFDVLGLALEGLGNTYELSLCDAPSRVVSVTGLDSDLVPLDPAENLTLRAAHAMSGAYFSLSVHQELPVGGGLGSSAAACLAGAYGAEYLTPSPSPPSGEGSKRREIYLNNFCLPISPSPVAGEGLGVRSLVVAAQFEGHLDNLAPAYYGGLTIASENSVMQVSQGCDLWIVVVTPKTRLETKLARSVLPKELPQADWVRQMALSCALVCAWQRGDLQAISQALQDPYAEPRRAPLIPGFHEVKQSALDSGALGCSISGAGPTVFALFSAESKARDFALSHNGHVGKVAKQGIRVC